MVPLLPLNGINRQKWTVGSFRALNGERQGFLLKGTAMIPIPVPNCPEAEAFAVNDAGEVVGGCGYAERLWHWKDGTLTVLSYQDSNLPVVCGVYLLAATGINNTGIIAAQCTDSGVIIDHGTWTQFNGDASNPLKAYIYPTGINDKGTVYGTACEDQDEFFAAQCAGFILKNSVMSFVEYPGAAATQVTAVHPTNGRIWGNWLNSAGVVHAFTATP
jgi:hypothetical protein